VSVPFSIGRDDLLPSEHDEEVPCLADRLDGGGVSIKRGNLVIELHTWLSCGSYGVRHEGKPDRETCIPPDMGGRFAIMGIDFKTKCGVNTPCRKNLPEC